MGLYRAHFTPPGQDLQHFKLDSLLVKTDPALMVSACPIWSSLTSLEELRRFHDAYGFPELPTTFPTADP